ncbi:MAG: VWA domain-containing protein [Myxococcota bacterium]|nr:VWA domain-containing protein [Myxococcota bacterium]
MRIISWFTTVALSLALAACSSEHMSGMGEAGSYSDTPSMSEDGGDSAGDDSQQTQGPAAGQLTAGSWDDNQNYERYLAYRDTAAVQGYDALPFAGRKVITVTDSTGQPVGDASVRIMGSDEQIILEAKTVSDGRILFFTEESDQDFTVTATRDGANQTEQVTSADDTWAITLGSEMAKNVDTLDIALVIDTTGSMGDELDYIQSELDWVLSEVAQSHPTTDVRVGLVLYRDQGDAYVTQTVDFTSDSDAFLAALAEGSAGGGGDYPEAMGEAMHAAMELNWSERATRLLFLIADAPPQKRRNASVASSARKAQEMGVRIYPIAASGVANTAEWVMRQAAQFTLGHYLFLTDHSGIGLPHEEPTIPCYHVEYLNELMVRVIDNNMQGSWVDADSDAVITSIGYDDDGQCVGKQPVEPTP